MELKFSAYHGLDPDPMWLGPLNAAAFLSVVDDLIWMFLDGNLRHGFPLIDDCAPAARCEMPVSRARRRHLPLNLFFVRERELVVAAIAVEQGIESLSERSGRRRQRQLHFLRLRRPTSLYFQLIWRDQLCRTYVGWLSGFGQ